MRRIIIALAILGIIGTADANPRQIRQYHQTVIIHKNKTDVVPYIFAGIIVGLIIYDISVPKCENGLICTKF